MFVIKKFTIHPYHCDMFHSEKKHPQAHNHFIDGISLIYQSGGGGVGLKVQGEIQETSDTKMHNFKF